VLKKQEEAAIAAQEIKAAEVRAAQLLLQQNLELNELKRQEAEKLLEKGKKAVEIVQLKRSRMEQEKQAMQLLHEKMQAEKAMKLSAEKMELAVQEKIAEQNRSAELNEKQCLVEKEQQKALAEQYSEQEKILAARQAHR
jgi:hypothetical protein